MLILWILGALAAIAAGALLLMERKIRLRHRRVLAAQVEADPSAPVVIEPLPMRHLGTRFADELPLRAPWAAAGDVQVVCTAQALVVGALVVPLAQIDDAAIAGGALRVRFRRGGELLETQLQAPLQDLERLRREIHLRQPNVIEKLIEMVQK